ncbi:MAG TPA: hypothetical protein VHV31_14005 [Nitrolancea sp.]|nr:hypothetical protein [Nitrolancea sp.]
MEPRTDPFADRFDESYLRLCLKQGRSITAKLEPRIGDFLLGPAGLRLITEASEPKATNEVVVPDLDRVLALLQAAAPIIVLDSQVGDFGLTAFDEYHRSLANVVSHNAPEACLRALLFIRAESSSNTLTSGVLTLNPAQPKRSDN